MDSPFMTSAEAAAYLHVSVRTLTEWRWTGRGGPRYRKHGTRVFYVASDLDLWSASQSRLSSSDAPPVAVPA